SPGHCMTMGTASTMAALLEALGMALPGSAAMPGADARRGVLAERTGREIVELVKRGTRPSEIMTERAFENAVRVLLAIGGSTNAVIHLAAVAGRVGIGLPPSEFDDLSRTTPMIVDLKPSGAYLMEDLFYAGGIPAVLARLAPLLHMGEMTVNGRTLAENVAGARSYNDEVIHSLERPIHAEGGLAVVTGSLAPDGAVIKQTAASPKLMRHRGRAVVFEDAADLRARIDDPALDVTPDDVIVMKNAGPVGGPGMPEWGFLPIPRKLLEAGVRDIVRISDARMSGTAFGTIVLHVSPEAAVGGPLALVQDGDEIELDVPNRRLDLLVDAGELARRGKAWRVRPAHFDRGYGKLYVDHVMQAQHGCDFDFLRGKSPVETLV
ncbi:MAG: dihydroxy-acid dehydratase, partial [Gemmatimonadetes bacterium]|nr:dihydroxy-acid dehydratase [Gemmatimonadota bacterium]